jgi:UDP-N-acetylmuramoyl-tripeptide--D-alanyl-D-alanine ligase
MSGDFYFCFDMIQELFAYYLTHPVVTTDSRKITPGCIFFALKGEHFNGNDFLQLALDQGAGRVVGDEERGIQDKRCLICEDSLHALQALARQYRESWRFPVIGITGSNGKTTTKELVRDVLSTRYKVHATKGNLNNHIGVPLTILSAPQDTELAIIEMGANHQKEIASYCQYAQPTHGFITNIGKAHLEGFGGQEGVKKGKKELYDYLSNHGGEIFVNLELPWMQEITNGMSIIPFGQHFSIVVNDKPNGMDLLLDLGQERIPFSSLLTGAYNVYNVQTALEIGFHFGVDMKKAAQAVADYLPENMRSQWKETEKNKLIIDAYNANPTSLEHALIHLSKITEGDTLAIVGEMREMGEYSAEEHGRMVELLTELGLAAILVGKEFEPWKMAFPYFETVDTLISWMANNPVEHKTILIKGSRGIQLERVIPCL